MKKMIFLPADRRQEGFIPLPLGLLLAGKKKTNS